jgi:hypothetical protein
MAKGKNKARDKDKAGPVAIIRHYTESAERIGADAALLGIIIVMGSLAMIAGTDAIAVTIFGLGGYGLWIVTKFANAYLGVTREQLELDQTRVARGQKILEAHPDRQKRLALPKEGS